MTENGITTKDLWSLENSRNCGIFDLIFRIFSGIAGQNRSGTKRSRLFKFGQPRARAPPLAGANDGLTD
jgi:hypothetical protein